MKNLAIVSILLVCACSSHSPPQTDQRGSRLPRTFSTVPATFDVLNINSALDMSNAAVLGWSSTLTPTGVKDVGVARNAAGVLEINNGTSGTLRDGLARSVTLNTDGQAALFSTFGHGAPSGNIWIGGGGQSFAGSVFPGTGQSTALGIGALQNVTTGNQDTCIGNEACSSITTGYTTTAVGTGVLSNDTTGVDNTAIGYLSAVNLTTGSTNTSVGTETLSACTTCSANVAVGISAGQLLTTGSDNVAIGHQSTCGTTGSFNACFGSRSGAGIQASIADVAIGPFTLQASTSANANIAIGTTALTADTTGANNVGIGPFANVGVTSGSENVAVGDHASGLGGNIANNVAIGALAGEVATVGFNVLVGYSAGVSITSGVANTVIGYNDTLGVTTGNSNTVVGGNIAGLSGGLTGNVILANGVGVFRLQTDNSGNATWNPAAATATAFQFANVPTASNGTLDASANNYRGRITTVGATSTTLTFGSGGFGYVAHCTTQPEGSGILTTGIDVNPSATAPVFSCFTLATGVGANCPNFTYRCD